MNEDVEVMNLHGSDLPQNPLGYEPVDAVVWLDGDPLGARRVRGRKGWRRCRTGCGSVATWS